MALIVGSCSPAHQKPIANAEGDASVFGASNGVQREHELALLRQELTLVQSRTSQRGVVLTIPDVLSGVDQTNLKASAQRDLVSISAFLKKHPDQKVLIEGYSDSTGTEASNQELSLRRGTVVETFFLRNGVDPERLEVRGRGENDPIASNATASGRQQNRRVEVVMLNANDETARSEERTMRYCR